MNSCQFLAISEEQCDHAEWIVKRIKERGNLTVDESSVEALNIFFAGLATNRLEQTETYFHSQLSEHEQLFAKAIYKEVLH